MNGIHIRTLQQDDSARLLEFEEENRAWFEQHIQSRGDAFYSLSGVRDHINIFLDGYAEGTLHPCVIIDSHGAVIGRANLKDIDRRAGTAEIGYRIAESRVGSGLATEAVRFLVELARAPWQLRQLHAYVAHQNAASARVLEKSMFTRGQGREDCGADGGALRFERSIT